MRALPILPPLLLAALAGCAVGPDYHAPTLAMPAAYGDPQPVAAPMAQDLWWRGFGDPLLARLVARAIAGNTDLAQARARIDQSRAMARGAGALLLPAFEGAADASASHQSLATPLGVVSRRLGLPRDTRLYEAGIEASWELDLFGGVRRDRDAARADLDAMRATAGAVAVAVAGETADAYVTLRLLQARLGLAQAQAAAQATLADLMRQRVDQGLSARREADLATARLAAITAAMAPLRAAIAAQMNRIDTLLGDLPGTGRAALAPEGAIPAAPLPAGGAAPADLLRRRPDVVAAERRVAAANARIGGAMADYYPRLSLSGLIGVASLGTSNLFTGEGLQASGGGGLRWRLFDFGRVDAQVAQARGAQAEALAAWRGSVLGAAEDVETALSHLREAHAESQARAGEETALEAVEQQARMAYDGGVGTRIDALWARLARLEAQDRAAQARGQETRAAIHAYRALGGGWADETARLASAAPTAP